MGGQDLRPTVSSLKRPRFPDSDSDSDDAVTVLGDTVKRQRTHDSDDGLLAMEDSIRELDDLLHHEGSSSSTTEAYDCWDDDLLGSLIDDFELLPDSAVAASAADEAAVVPQLTTHLRHHDHEIEEGPRTTDERELDDEEDLITEFFNHIGGEDDEDPNQDHVHQATEPDHTALLITIIPFPPSQIIILPAVVGNIGRPRVSVLHVPLDLLAQYHHHLEAEQEEEDFTRSIYALRESSCQAISVSSCFYTASRVQEIR